MTMTCAQCGGEMDGTVEHPEPLVQQAQAAAVYQDSRDARVPLDHREGTRARSRMVAHLEWASWWLPAAEALVHRWKVTVLVEKGETGRDSEVPYWAPEKNPGWVITTVGQEVLTDAHLGGLQVESVPGYPLNRHRPAVGVATGLAVAAFNSRAAHIARAFEPDLVRAALRTRQDAEDNA